LSVDALSERDLLEVQEYFGLPSPALVEKDFHVVKALTAIAAVEAAPFKLVFGGGTALSRAHRLISRMSEDIDLKIVAETDPPRSALRRLRDNVTQALLDADFVFDPNNAAHRQSRNESKYTIFRLPYPAIMPGEGALRPEIQVELSLWPLRRPAVDLPVTSFVAEANGRQPELPSLACVSVAETAAEKLVALTRRAATEMARADGERDPTLVRHLYDLHVLRAYYDPADVAALARDVMQDDARAYGNQFPAYRDNPLGETLRAVECMSTDGAYKAGYAAFHDAMIYGDHIDFGTCIATLQELAAALRPAL